MSDLNITKFPHIAALEKDKRVEYEEPVQGHVEGQVPAWLRGSFYRNGPGIIHFKEQSVTHWFDGMALPRRFEIKDGGVSYISRLIRSQSYQKNTDAGRIVVPEFGTHVQTKQSAGFLSKAITMIALPEFTDNCLVNIMRVGKDIYGISETNVIRRLDPITLETLEKVDLSKYVPVTLMSSNPLIDSDGTVYNFTTSLLSMGRTKYNLVAIPKSETGTSYKEALSKAKCVASIDSAWRVSPSYHHSFAMSQNKVVFTEMPLKLNIPKLAVAHWSNIPYSDCLEAHFKLNTNFFIIDKHEESLSPTVYVTDPIIVYQHVNAYEQDDHLVLDLCYFDSDIFFQKYSMKNLEMSPEDYKKKFDLPQNHTGSRRFVIPLSVPKDSPGDENLVKIPGTSCTALKQENGNIFLTGEDICKGTDYPTINPKYVGKPYRYFYSSGGEVLPPGEQIIKVDTKKKEKTLTWKEKGCWASCPQFVPTPTAVDEDDGIVMASVHCENDKPFLLLLDGRSFEEKARVTFDANIPPDLHGMYIPDDE